MASLGGSVLPNEGDIVEMHGVMEIRIDSDDPHAEFEPLDLRDFLDECPDIPEDYTAKDRHTGEQSYFYCLLCRCDMRSLIALHAHAGGKKHVSAALKHKRQTLGMPERSLAVAQIKDKKKEPPVRLDPNATLGELLKRDEGGDPAIGLRFVEEVWSRSRPDKRPLQYSCSLTDCKSAWGVAVEMKNHVINPKHIKNYFRFLYPGDNHIHGLTKNETIKKALEYVNSSEYDADDDCVRVVRDDRRFQELTTRPIDWSEKKAKFDLVGNANRIPLGGSRKRHASDRSDGDCQEVTATSLLGSGFKAADRSRDERHAAFEKCVVNLVSALERETASAVGRPEPGHLNRLLRIQAMKGVLPSERLPLLRTPSGAGIDAVLQGAAARLSEPDRTKYLVRSRVFELSRCSPASYAEAEAFTQEVKDLADKLKLVGLHPQEGNGGSEDAQAVEEVMEKLKELSVRLHSEEAAAKSRFLADLKNCIAQQITKQATRPELLVKMGKDAAETIMTKESAAFLEEGKPWTEFAFSPDIEAEVCTFLQKKFRKISELAAASTARPSC